ncbi:MAG: hypothetical protein EA401_06495 [Planctomycetota bacterium]|nr:MAG: hypothetical protein EA401_06495 [Planctomycetota bacterium]
MLLSAGSTSALLILLGAASVLNAMENDPPMTPIATIFSGEVLPSARPDHRQQVVIGLPGIGGRSDRSVFVRTHLRDGEQDGQIDLRSWQFQEDLQPSHIRRLQRVVDTLEFSLEDGHLQGTIAFTLSGPQQLGNPAVEYRFRGQFRLNQSPETLPPLLRSDFSTPSWRRVDFPLHGVVYTGQITGTWQRNDDPPQDILQEVWAARSPLLHTGTPVSGGDWPSHWQQDAQGGPLIWTAFLPEQVVDASEHADLRWRLPEPVVVREANALRVTWRSQAHNDLAANVIIHDHLGQQWQRHGALPLLGGERTTVIPLQGFTPSWYTALFDLDAEAIQTIGLSLSAGHGPGTVAMELLAIEAVHDPSIAERDPTVRITWDPHALRSTNGQEHVHPALFGVHGVGSIPEERRADVAAMNLGSIRTIEHSSFSPKNGPPENNELRQMITHSQSAMSEAIHCFTRGLFDPPPWFTHPEEALQRKQAFGAALGRHGYHPQHHPDGVQWIEVWNEPFLWGRHINRAYGNVHDPRQAGHYSGPLAAFHYAAIYNTLVGAARAENPHLRFAGPSSSAFGANDWRQLTDFVLPIIAATHHHLDAIAEHHYQGRGHQFAAEWLVADAAIQAITGRSIPIWNTETNDLSDTPGGWGDSDDRPRLAGQRKRAAYQLDEILHHISHIPHIARGRAIHMLHNGRFLNPGEAAAMHFLAPLRGAIVPIDSSDPRVPIVATRDGEELIIIAYNDHAHSVSLEWSDPMPQPDARLTWDNTHGSQVRSIKEHDTALEIPPLQAVRWRMPAPQLQRHHIRHLRPGLADDGGPAILRRFHPGDSHHYRFADTPDGSPSHLWVVSEGMGINHGHVRFACGQELPLPADTLGTRMIRSLALPAGVDASSIEIMAHPNSHGFRIASISAVWDMWSKRDPSQ